MTQVPPPDPKALGQLALLASVGLEMVAPLALGWLADRYLGCQPWGVVVGAVLGMVGGVAHLMVVANAQDRRRRNGSRQPPGAK